MTRLTKEMKKQIINSVLNSTTLDARTKAVAKSTKIKVREVLLERLPKDFAEKTASLPKAWFPQTTAVFIDPDVNPIAIAMDIPKDKNGYRNTYEHANVTIEAITVPGGSGCRGDLGMDSSSSVSTGGNKKDFWVYMLRTEIEYANKIKEDREAIVAELTAFLDSAKSYKDIIERMPRLEEHLPYHSPTSRALVASTGKLNLLLSGAGFDTGAKSKTLTKT